MNTSSVPQKWVICPLTCGTSPECGEVQRGTDITDGATGFLGGAVLHQSLSRRDGTEWVCLVRCTSAEQGRQRIAARLSRFTDPFTAQRLARAVEVVPGDFTRADLDADPRLDSCTHVLHLAADTSWWGEERVSRTNHDGTLALARRARGMPGLVRFLHVSTAMICGAEAPSLVEEADYPSRTPGTSSPTRSRRRRPRPRSPGASPTCRSWWRAPRSWSATPRWGPRRAPASCG